MAFYLTTDQTGEIAQGVRLCKMISTDSIAAITAPGYLDNANLNPNTIAPTDFIFVTYGLTSVANGFPVGQPAGYQTVNASIVNGVITLIPTYEVAPHALSKVFTLTAAQLASAGKVNVFTARTTTASIAITDIKVFLSTGLSGNSGNRLLSLTDGTLVFNNAGITAALLGTPVFTIWGGTGNPLTSSTEASLSTPGNNVYLQYTGGSADYNAGSFIVEVSYVQVTY